MSKITNVAKVILVNPDLRQLLLIRRSVTDNRRPNQWDIPGGQVELAELIESAAVRECREEVGIHLKQESLKLIYVTSDLIEDNNNTNTKRLVNWIFFTANTNETEVSLSYEHNDFRWLDLKEAIKLIVYQRQKIPLELALQFKLIPELFPS